MSSLQVHSLIEFTNIKCESVDKDFAEFEYCRLKSQNRTFKYISLKVNLFKVPISRIKVCTYIINFSIINLTLKMLLR